MSSETLQVKKRDGVGSTASKKLRLRGEVPANLYGHGEGNLNLAISADAINNIIKHGTKLIALTGDVNDTAILREVQWDTFGVEVLHVDFTRVSQGEAVELTLSVHLHGEAPGLNEGGMLAFTTHELTIRCPASSIPEHLEVNVSKLHLGDVVHASDVVLPSGAEMLTTGNLVVVQITKQSDDSDTGESSEVEPELIRDEKEEGGE